MEQALRIILKGSAANSEVFSFLNCPFRDFLKLQAPRSKQETLQEIIFSPQRIFSSACAWYTPQPSDTVFHVDMFVGYRQVTKKQKTVESLNSAFSSVICVKETAVKIVFTMTSASLEITADGKLTRLI